MPTRYSWGWDCCGLRNLYHHYHCHSQDEEDEEGEVVNMFVFFVLGGVVILVV